jgi:hypothetical protein
MQQKVAVPDQPALGVWRQSKRWYQIVDVGVVAHLARPGLQDAQHANLPAQEARILGELLERRCGRAKQQGIDRLRLLSSERTQLGGQREGNQEVGHGQ